MVERLTLEQLADRSERIVHGRCGRTWSAWDENRQFIWTHCELEVLDPLKGGPAGTITVSEPGGVADGLEMSVDGVSRPAAGEEVVLFLYRVPNGFWRARGLSQGKYRVDREKVVHAMLEASTVVEPRQPPAGRSTDLRRLDRAPLQEFKAAVRRALARPATAREK